MNNGMIVIMYEKQPNGELKLIDERTWDANMIASLQHVNYLHVSGQEYQTIEGKLNVDTGKLELLVVPMNND
ncbi:hypothetical protein ACFPYJ_11580 [Paenibacillus solisilvae]|uniref:Uncharacterized protein n=1 Tax=Paenibacillus solisilvae TaxID=2486751 RepID=A0ABW0W002_9BACL